MHLLGLLPVISLFTSLSLSAHVPRPLALAPRITRPVCGSDNPSPATLSAIQALAEAEANGTVSLLPLTTRATVTVTVYYHVLSNTSISATYPPDSLLASQLTVMNNAYSAAGMRFVLGGTDRTRSNTLATGDGYFSDTPSAAMTSYLKANRLGTYRDLNIFLYTNMPDSLFGRCAFPNATAPNSTASGGTMWKDTCHIATGTLPGQDFTGYNLGMTAVHEIGHWLSLMHPFQGNSCDPSNAGDMISDTPQEQDPTYGCPATKDSCPTLPGVDPVHNYMDYSEDGCYTNFTQGQYTRMQNAWTSYRAGK